MIARRDFINRTLRAGAAKSAAPRAFREHRFAAPRLARATLDVATHSSPRHQSINILQKNMLKQLISKKEVMNHIKKFLRITMAFYHLLVLV